MPEIALSRGKPPAVVHIPQQTAVGFEVYVPTDGDARDLTRYLDHSRMGRGRPRVQPAYSVRAVELKWLPSGHMPTLREFSSVVTQWAQHKGYAMARDMRDLRSGLEDLRGGRTAHAIMARFAASEKKLVETVLERAYFHVNNGGLSIELIEKTSYTEGVDGEPKTYRTYVCRYSFGSMGGSVSGEFDLGSEAMVEWLIGALTRVLPRLSQEQTKKTFSPYESAPEVTIMDGASVEEAPQKSITDVISETFDYYYSGSAQKVANRYATSKDGVVTTMARGRKLLADLGAWVAKFPQVLRVAEQGKGDLPSGWVWQDEFLSFFNDYDSFIERFQDIDHSLEGHWLKQTGKIKEAVGVARRALREPNGKAAVTYPTNSFSFMPHPEKGEHIAYKVADLKTWYKAFADWVDAGDRAVTNTMQVVRKKTVESSFRQASNVVDAMSDWFDRTRTVGSFKVRSMKDAGLTGGETISSFVAKSEKLGFEVFGDRRIYGQPGRREYANSFYVLKVLTVSPRTFEDFKLPTSVNRFDLKKVLAYLETQGS